MMLFVIFEVEEAIYCTVRFYTITWQKVGLSSPGSDLSAANMIHDGNGDRCGLPPLPLHIPIVRSSFAKWRNLNIGENIQAFSRLSLSFPATEENVKYNQYG